MSEQVIRWHVHEHGSNLRMAHGHKLEEPEQHHDHPAEGHGPVAEFLQIEVQP